MKLSLCYDILRPSDGTPRSLVNRVHSKQGRAHRKILTVLITSFHAPAPAIRPSPRALRPSPNVCLGDPYGTPRAPRVNILCRVPPAPMTTYIFLRCFTMWGQGRSRPEMRVLNCALTHVAKSTTVDGDALCRARWLHTAAKVRGGRGRQERRAVACSKVGCGAQKRENTPVQRDAGRAGGRQR